MFFIAFCAIIFLFVPQESWAWGPGVHMVIGNHVLGNLAHITPDIAVILRACPTSFLYGCLSADIFIGKGSGFTPRHPHNWDMGRALLREARTPSEEAHAWGYLSHLAADVIAHNYLVPNILGFSRGRGKFAHTYAEMLADLLVEWPVQQGTALFQLPHRDADSSLMETMGRKKLPFIVKKGLFQQSVYLVETAAYRHSLRIFGRVRKHAKRERFVTQAICHAEDLVFHMLANPNFSPVFECDPVGSANLDQVRFFKKRQRFYYGRHDQGIIFPLDTRLEPCLRTQGALLCNTA